jgi:hypothetical protein
MAKQETTVRNLGTVQKRVYHHAPKLNTALVEEFVHINKEYDQIQIEQKDRVRKLEELRGQIIEALPGKSEDQVELNINGIIFTKTSRKKATLKEEMVYAFARAKRLLKKVATKKWVFDKKAIDREAAALISAGKMTQEQYDKMFEIKWTPVIDWNDTRDCPPISQPQDGNAI